MGVSFTFVTVLSTVSANYGYPAVVGAVLIGGIFEGTLGLFAKYWRKIIAPVVAASVVTAIGIGFTAASEEGLWNIFPSMVQDVFASNVVAVVFVVAVVLNLVLPANMDIHHENKK